MHLKGPLIKKREKIQPTISRHGLTLLISIFSHVYPKYSSIKKDKKIQSTILRHELTLLISYFNYVHSKRSSIKKKKRNTSNNLKVRANTTNVSF